MQATFSWGGGEVDYAADVFFGPTYLDGSKGPARPWTDITVQGLDLGPVFAASLGGPRGDWAAAFRAAAEHLGEEFDMVVDFYNWGIDGAQRKEFRDSPTWRLITDSGALRDSRQLDIQTGEQVG